MSSLTQSLFFFPGLVSVKYTAQRLKMVLVSTQQGGSQCPEASYKIPNSTVGASSSSQPISCDRRGRGCCGAVLAHQGNRRSTSWAMGLGGRCDSCLDSLQS